MVSLIVDEVKEFAMYVLEDQNKQKYQLGFELYGMGELAVGDKILISNELLNSQSQKFCVPYAFEITNEYNPQQIKDLNNDEYIVVKHDDKIICMKRIYG